MFTLDFMQSDAYQHAVLNHFFLCSSRILELILRMRGVVERIICGVIILGILSVFVGFIFLFLSENDKNSNVTIAFTNQTGECIVSTSQAIDYMPIMSTNGTLIGADLAQVAKQA